MKGNKSVPTYRNVELRQRWNANLGKESWEVKVVGGKEAEAIDAANQRRPLLQ